MGIDTPLQEIFSFIYRAEVENGLTEHELDHVFAGEYEGIIDPHEEEVAGYKYENLVSIKEAMKNHPSHFTTWFRIAFPSIEKWWQERYGLQAG